MELNDFIKKLNNSKDKAYLSAERKKAIRGRILYLINLSEKPKVRTASFFFPILRPMPIMAGVLALVLAGGTISFAAEGSLPGDILYPVKIKINENLIAAVKFTPEDKASWEVDKTERRLTEASTLISKGSTNSAAKEEVETSFDNSSNQAQDGIKSLENEGNATTAAEIAAKLEAILKVHQQILNAVKDGQDSTSTVTLEDKVSDKLAKVEVVKALIQAKIAANTDQKAVSSDAQNGIQKAKDKIYSVRKFVKNNSDKLSIEATKDANRKLSDADLRVKDAQGKLKDGISGEAFNSANDAGEEAQKVQLLMNANISFGISSGGEGSATMGAVAAPQATSTTTSTPPGSNPAGN
jgi:hypothetical protein